MSDTPLTDKNIVRGFEALRITKDEEQWVRAEIAQKLERALAAKTAECEALQHDIARHIKTCTELATECEALREDARHTAVGAAIERAAAELPDNYSVEIHIERGAASVYIVLPDGSSGDIDVDADNRLAAEINAAIDAARKGTP